MHHDDFYRVNTTQRSNKVSPHPSSSTQPRPSRISNIPSRPTSSPSRQTGTIYLPSKIYQSLDENTKKLLKEHNEAVKRGTLSVNLHDLTDCLDDAVDETQHDESHLAAGHDDCTHDIPTAQPEDTTLLNLAACGTSEAPLDIDICHVMSATTRPSPNPHRFHVSMAYTHDITYRIPALASNAIGTPMDCSANDGLAGKDVRVPTRTGCKVPITGTDNHALSGVGDAMPFKVHIAATHKNIYCSDIYPDDNPATANRGLTPAAGEVLHGGNSQQAPHPFTFTKL